MVRSSRQPPAMKNAPRIASDHRSPSSCCTSSSSVTNCDIGYSHDSRHNATFSPVTTPTFPTLTLTLALSHVSTPPLHAAVPPAMDPAPASTQSPFAMVPQYYLIEGAEKIRSSLFGGNAPYAELNLGDFALSSYFFILELFRRRIAV
ncbi:uncharacterized protein FFUJ_12734 [Fusarium fujikuroi IMI 58289]|uniref:Uncharacterized protein n=1 Tax=Gibberella fujikuroi (strain CBS 195.34 / IMI 58289 / NRRL A-6831) TaxID=1279085 RepID=S0EDV2_GIBF5|nr:uncharacterized protein FFUJ_12734 [Fusarium fujikuroi IMI 58289]KLP19099.1 uncharacterized protein LW94_470 [Fusarium fujikuroi]CCT72840.1 uncharacterized protein FFUJ_12734 [Fusarium fujikuroi IMI 58289]SCO25114.1 uncharacterized protein FFM5_13967 [Fusarium fujikuroi]SCO54149.1 uncharacterized protein FFMR_11668 [Fusarium fujikuroi]VTT60601.1 unnamed protein product [Fusarium fujikuroi]